MSSLEEEPGERIDAAPPAGGGFLTILWQRKALVFLATTLGLLGGALYYWQSAPVYQSTAQLWMIKKNTTPLPIAGGDPRMGYVEDYMATHLHVLKSPVVIDRAIRKKDLASLKTFENCGDPVGLIRGAFSANRDTREASEAANILVLSFRGPVADECGMVLAAIVESFQESLDIAYRNASDQTLDLITKARDQLKKDLAESEEKYLAFQQKSSLYWKTRDGASLQLERVASVDSKLSALLQRHIEVREQMKYFEKALKDGKDAEPLIALINSQMEAKSSTMEKAVKENLLPLLLQEKQLLETFQADHPQVKSIRARINLLREQYGVSDTGELPKDGGKSTIERYLIVLREDLHLSEMKIQSQTDLLEKLKAEAKDVKNNEILDNHLRQDVERTRQLYGATIKRLQEINLVRESGGVDAKLLSTPGTGAKIAPTTRQTILLGLALGLLAGVGLAYLADMTDKSFRSPDEVRRLLALPLLGHVPFLKPDPKSGPVSEAGEKTVEPLLCTLYRPRSLESEAFRAIRTALFFSTQDDGHKVLQFSSPNKGDGKSLTVSNLAISMAQSGKKVLIIDADCRRPRQHKNFNLANTTGLVTVIAEGLPWRDAVQPSPMEGLSIMPSGPIPPNASEMLSHHRFAELLESARAEYDFVIVDSPPLLAVTDPCVVAGQIDGLVLVLRLSRQSRPNAERARQILLSLGVNILGVIVNGIVRQGGSGIYSSEHYDYSETYEDRSNWDAEGDYYYEDEEASEDVSAKQDLPGNV